MMRVPGGRGSLLEAKARGADVRMVYSPLDALALAAKLPDRRVVFFAIGFETTAPATAVTLLRARAAETPNFAVFCNHVTIEPPLRAILETPGLQVDAFIGPGHVSTVIGTDAYRFIPEEYGRPVVVSAFEPVDLLQSIAMLLRQRAEGRCEVENQYTRVVRPRGQRPGARGDRRDDGAARRLRVARPRHDPAERAAPAAGVRRLGRGGAVRACPGVRIEDPKACRCGEVLTGQIKPWECGVFGTACTPERPLGTCMVSSEGACAAFYAYGRLRRPSRRSRLARRRAVLRDELITLAHGAGGKATRDLVEALFLQELGNDTLAELGDAAVVAGAGRLALSTDAYVVHPLEFPGGDIGELAVNGTVNDLAMVGARPLWLTAGLRDRGGLPGRRPAADRRLDGRRRAGSRGRGRRRRHEGRRARQGRRALRDDGRRRRRSPTASTSARSASGPATACSSPARSPTTAWR